MRRAACLAVLGLACLASPLHAASGASAAPEAAKIETVGLRSVAGWLKAHGTQGYLGADVADAMGIPRLESEDLLVARQRGFRTEDVLRVAQISADEKRDFLLFMVQRPDDQVYFYLSSVREGLKKAFVSIPSKNLVMPLDPMEAEARFRQEVRYWGDRMEAK